MSVKQTFWENWGQVIVLTALGVGLYAADARFGTSSGGALEVVSDQVGDLHAWHNITDEDGVKIWYVPRSHERALRELASAIRAETIMLERMSNNFTHLTETVERLDR